MTTPTTGAITIKNLAQEFGGAAPHSLSEYYSVATGIPASGQISLSAFYNKTRSLTAFNFVTTYQVSTFYVNPRGLGSFAGFPLISYIGSYTNQGQAYTSDSVNYYIGTPTSKVVIDYSWENGGNGTSIANFINNIYPLATHAFASVPFFTLGSGNADSQIQFTLNPGYTVSYYQQDQHGTGNDLGRTGQTYTIWKGGSVSGLYGVPGISGSGNGGSRFQISRIS